MPSGLARSCTETWIREGIQVKNNLGLLFPDLVHQMALGELDQHSPAPGTGTQEEGSSQGQLHPGVRKDRTQPGELAWSKRGSTSRNSPLDSPNTDEAQEGKGSFQLLSFLLPKTLHLVSWWESWNCWESPAMALARLEGKEAPQQHLAHIHHGKTSPRKTPWNNTQWQHLQVCSELLKLDCSWNSRVVNIPRSSFVFYMQDRSENSRGKKSKEIIKLAKLGMVFSRNILLAQPPRKTRDTHQDSEHHPWPHLPLTSLLLYP